MIKIGTALTLERMEQGEIEKYRCKVIEQSEEMLFIDYPVNETTGRTGIFEKGTEFLVQFIGEENAVYQFVAELKGKERLNIPSLLLNRPEKKELKRIQRREYVRIETTNDIAVHHPEGEFPPFTSLTYDLSGGGLTIYLLENLQIASKMTVEVWLALPIESGKIEYIQAVAETVRTEPGREGKKGTLSVQFKEIEDRDRQTIIRYCFSRQLRDRRQSTGQRR